MLEMPWVFWFICFVWLAQPDRQRVSGGDRACFFVTQKFSARRGRPADESMAVGPRSMNFLSLEKI